MLYVKSSTGNTKFNVRRNVWQNETYIEFTHKTTCFMSEFNICLILP